MTYDCRVLSLRRIRRVPWYGGLVGVEDVLVRTLGGERLDVVANRPSLSGRTRRGRITRRVLTLSPVAGPFSTDPEPDRRAKLLVIVVNDLHDLALCMSVAGWESLADEVVVHVSETSERHLKIYGSALRRLQRCPNHIFLGSRYVEPDRLAGSRTRSVGVTVPLVDVLSFPVRSHDERRVDILSFGRHSEVQNSLLEAWARQHPEREFRRDTARIDFVSDLHDHRRSFIDRTTAARVIVTNYARFDEPRRTAGMRMLGTRFVEAAAAGAVLAGEPPTHDLPGYTGLLDTLRIARFPVASPELPVAVRDALQDRARSQEIGNHVRRLAVERLDVAHQWMRMAAVAHLPVSPGVCDRLRLLAASDDHVS